MTREELLKSPAYWTTEIQSELYREISRFMELHKLNRTQLAERLGCSKGYVTQVLSGDYDHKLSKFVELSMAIGKIPELKFVDVSTFIESEKMSGTTTFDYQGNYIPADQFSENEENILTAA